LPTPQLHIGRFKIEMYYLAVLVGFFLACLWLVLSALFWTHDLTYGFILFGATLISCYTFNVVKQFVSESPEYSIYHYFLMLAVVGWICSFWFGRNLALTMDLFLMSFSIAAASGRLGCYHAGCCFGKKGFPTQIAESGFHALNFIGGIVLLRFVEPGFTALVLATSYAVFRFWIEFLLADERPYLWGISEAQFTASAILIVLSLISLFHYSDWWIPMAFITVFQNVVLLWVLAKSFRKRTI